MTRGPRLTPTVRELPFAPDLVDLVASARDSGREVMLMERPMPEAVSLAGIGRAFDIVSTPEGVALEDTKGRVLLSETGSDPIEAASRLWRRLIGSGSGRYPIPATGVVALGGFAFEPRHEPEEPWTGFPGLLLRIPALLVTRIRGRTFVSALTPDAEEMLEPSTGIFRAGVARNLEVLSARSPSEWMSAVEIAIANIRSGELDKVVLARELVVEADGVIAAASVARSLRASYPACFTYVLGGSDGSALVGASPELLVRRRGRLVTSEPMAGSIGRGADEAQDEALAAELVASAKDRAEHALVPRQVAAALTAAARWVSIGEPVVTRFTNLQHLATTIQAELAGDVPANALEVVARLHPTPAVAGHPQSEALRTIHHLEGVERGWYAGGVGWLDSRGDGEFAVTLRCGLLSGSGAHLYAGGGIMADSDPERELAETELKFQALLGSLTG